MMATGSATLRAAEPFLIQQDWLAYTPEQHATWAELVGRRMPQIEAYACEEYLQGFEQIGLRTDLIPNLADVNQRLRPRSGWRATPVSGFLLRTRSLPCWPPGSFLQPPGCAAGSLSPTSPSRISSMMSLVMCPCMPILSLPTFCSITGPSVRR